MADSVLNTDEKESSQQISGNLTEDDDVIELIVKDLVASALLNLAEDGHTEQCIDAKKRKYRREELISIVKQLEAQSLLQIPLGLDLTHPVLRDLDKSIPYERASYSHRNGPDRADEIKEQHVGEDQPNLKPSWAGSKFGQGAKQQPHHQASPSHGFEPSTSPKAPTGFPVRSRVLEEDASLRPTPPAKGSQNNYAQTTPSRGPWRGQDRDRDNFHGPDFSPEVQDNHRGHATANGARWGTNKPNDSWRGGKYHGQQQQQQQLDNEGRWGSGTEDEGDSGPSTEQLRRVGGGRRWDVEGPSRDRGEESSNRVRAGAGRQNLNVGRSMQMTAADIEAERLAFRRQAEAERAGKQERKRGIYDHDEVDMEDLMDNSGQRGEQPAALPANQAVAVSGAIKASPPPGFAQPMHEGVKMTFEQLAKASLGHFQGIPGKAMCLEDLEQKMVASAVPVATQRAVAPPPGFGHIMNASGLEVASVTTPRGLSNDAASKALLGMLKKAPSPATATPSVMPYGDSRAFEAAAAAAAAQQQTASQTLMGMLRKGNTQGNSNAPGAANAAGEAGLRSASAAGATAAASTMAGNVSATSGVPSIPNSVFNAFGEFAAPAVGKESSVIKAMAAPSLSSIWGAPSPNQLATAEAAQHFSAATPLPLAPLPTPPPNLSNIWGAPNASASPAGTAQSFVTTQGHNPALPSAAQAAATSLFEQLSYSAAPGSSQARSALAATGNGIGQPPQHAARPDNTLATLFAKAATGQLQQMAQAPSEALHSHVQHFQQLPQGGGVRSSFKNGGNTAPLVDDTLSLMLKDLGINTEPSNKVPPALTDLSAAPSTVAPGASAAAAARVHAIAAWQQQQQQGPKPQVPSSHNPAHHQTNMFSSGTPQSQNAANLQHLQALMAVNQQQAQQNMSYPSPQMNMQALLQKQQQQHQHIMHEQQMLQFQQELGIHPAMTQQELGIHPAMTQQPAGGPPGFPNGNVVQQLQALKMIQHQQQQHQALAASQQQQAAPRSTGMGPSASQDPAGKMARFFNAAANNPYSGLGLGLGQPAAITKPVGNGGAPVGLSVADLECLMGQRG
ncbi:hypothetical protein CEUSTIGMA_g9997.t1 [Chlamydomonas eustigma]|uniref:Uncharacterized protein n=1 Tax=Chlamydomonas eustigma TaxID=1157962 RepID=A0A250XHM4_9CHLO|nr:hypothetical protein CEUSTIGMA_g9997.t1 [Chlamydomonas eustigma]|eukprot:GAX82571.1 hypothetical protein CEUSTIGMA_g9997.t1 [Chlamydomonas eustigma]